MGTAFAIYLLTSVSTILLTLAVRDNPLSFLQGATVLLQISIVLHIALTFGVMLWALYMISRGGWSFEKRIGRFTLRGVSRIPPAPCMARPRRRRRGKPCLR